MKKVTIVTLNFNGWKDTKRLLESIRKLSYKNIEIIVIDNGSKDESVAELSKEKDIRFIPLTTNTGFTGGCNLGVKEAKGEYVALINNDAVVEKEWLTELVKELEANPDVAIVGSYIENKHSTARHSISKTVGTETLAGFYAKYPDASISDEPRKLYGLSGCSLLFRKSEIPHPYENVYFAYHDDAYLSWKTRLKKREIMMVPKSRVHHEALAVIRRDKKLKKYLTMIAERNRILNILLFYQAGNIILLTPYFIATTIIYNIFAPQKILRHIIAYAWIITHPFWIFSKRRQIQKSRQCKDNAIMRLMSGKLFEESNVPKSFAGTMKVLNSISLAYVKLIGIRTAEH